ncbi:hypothetical protein BOX15_Mlig028277g2 [Macrostomum lignano]|uniref:Uncharacterized protein n=1 Tax=Macrostomum lignano TaxID=282301 RepID=A0A267EMB9_9PLAT|nr:hypothetical protein BOX15_Mlig028277g2 [Macrostomum lignano]
MEPIQAGSHFSRSELDMESQQDDPNASKENHPMINRMTDEETEASSFSQPPGSGISRIANRFKRKQQNYSLIIAVVAITLGLVAIVGLVVFGTYGLHLHEGHHAQTASGGSPVLNKLEQTGPGDVTGTTPSTPSRKIQWIHVALNIKDVPVCTQDLIGLKPCRNRSTFITPVAPTLYPLRCVDDAYLSNPSNSTNNCDQLGALRLHPATGIIEVLEEGFYMMIMRVTIRLHESAEVHFGIAINDEHLAFLCTVSSTGASGPRQTAPYTQCSVEGLRRLKVGDKVRLFSPQSRVPLQSLYRSTYIQLARLGD